MENLSINGLKILLKEAEINEEYEKAAYIHYLIKKDKNSVNEHLNDKVKQINDIMDNFDFELVKSTMLALNWNWARETKSGIVYYEPELDKLKLTAYKLLEKIWNISDEHQEYSISTGGFNVTRHIYDGIKLLSLKFVLTEWITEFEDIKPDKLSE